MATAALTADPKRTPKVAPSGTKLPRKPRRPDADCSTRKTPEVVYSPPTDSPCTSRSSTSRIGAARPASLLVRRQYPDQKGRNRHKHDRYGQRQLASELVADMAKDQA